MSSEVDVTAFGDLLMPQEAAEPILAKPVRGALLEWLTEIWAEDELRAAKLQPRRRAIFDGPPGVGKTTLAHHLSARLGLPMLAVRPDRLVDKWLGSTGKNIGALFDAASRGKEPILLFLDEFDAIGMKRREASQGAEDERNSFVNTLLQCIDRFDGFLIAATNFSGHIDRAIWRRFDVHISLALPGQFERERILARYLDPHGLPSSALTAMAEALETASPALIRQLAEGLKRQIIIGPKVGWDMAKGAVVDRLLAAIQPHPDLGKPRLWSLGAADSAVRALPWPLPLAADCSGAAENAPESESAVVPFRRAP
ncbi:AAA family ATPase [Ancylobacter sp. IITR112]|uniref:AAA family ATPase n=1 Tax=Ancylobacter sp. IITR112 TaxID=3138073 RepID=UPI00352A31BA